MSKTKSLVWVSGMVAAALLCGCSNKVLPQGKRVSVLDQETAVKAEVANGAAQIQIPSAVPVASLTNKNCCSGASKKYFKYSGLIKV